MGLTMRLARPQPPARTILRLTLLISFRSKHGSGNFGYCASMASMRCKFVLFVFAILIAAFLFSCRSGGGGANRLLIYTPHGQDLLKDFVARYKQQHPNVDIQFLDMGSRQILERVTVERNRPQADLWWGASHTTFQSAADDNLLAQYRPTWADKVPADARDPNDRWFGTYATPQVIAYNSEAVSAADAPRDWDDV